MTDDSTLYDIADDDVLTVAIAGISNTPTTAALLPVGITDARALCIQLVCDGNISMMVTCVPATPSFFAGRRNILIVSLLTKWQNEIRK